VGPRKHVLDVGQDHTSEWTILGEMAYPGMSDVTAVSCAKMAEPIEVPFLAK